MDQKIIQQKSMQLQMRREQSKQLQQELMRIQGQLNEFEAVKDGLAAIGNEKNGASALVPVGGGIFFSGTVSNTKDALVSVGAGVVVLKSVPEAAEFIDSKIQILKNAINEIEAELKNISISAQMISREINGLSSHTQ